MGTRAGWRVSGAARRRALVAGGVLVDGAACCRLDGRGRVNGRACRRALMARQRARRGSGAASARACVLECLCAQGRGGRARERERGERKGVERERERSTGFDSKIIQIFALKLQKV